MTELDIIYAPSGAGKSTLEAVLIEEGSEAVVTATSRSKRDYEKNGIHYYFEDIALINSQIKNNEIASYITIGKDNDWKYAIQKEELNRIKGKGVLSIISAEYIINTIKHCIENNIVCNVFYINVSQDIRKERLVNRGESIESIDARFSFEDKYTIDEILNKFRGIIVINGNQTPEEVVKDFFKLKNLLN